MAPVKRVWSPRLKRPVAQPTPSLTMVRSPNSWLFCAMRSASSVEIRARCTWPSLLERLPSLSLARRIRRGMAPIAPATALAALLPSTLFCAVRTRWPPTNEAIKSHLPFSISMSIRFSTPFAAKLRSADECGRKFFRSLACTPRLSTCDSGSVFFPAHTSQHIAWRFGGSHWPLGARLCGRLPSQAGSPHRHRSLRIYPKSTLSWQRHPGSRGGNCSVLIELRLRHGASFEEYARAVPLFIPRLTVARLPGDSAGSFSFTQYNKNHEWQAAVGFLFLLFVLLVIWRLRLH